MTRHFWCLECRAWLPSYTVDDEPPLCCRCGEPFRCDECGYEIDAAGNCQRPEGHEWPEVYGCIAAQLNTMEASSCSGLFVVASILTGEVGTNLFTFGSRPRLSSGERLVKVGGHWTAEDVRGLV